MKEGPVEYNDIQRIELHLKKLCMGVSPGSRLPSVWNCSKHVGGRELHVECLPLWVLDRITSVKVVKLPCQLTDGF
eukprot:CAMPEP_0181420718 /NCGR_PEP_ID=MMETSP1110-20121109/12731_1 /TAXON_ID=174948 /ORGANISM="Symbiodinium sp., Strain CCMP421" /LENGTH=75 /DNA_ID=CAMNT_0023543769 /DNA_START=512 /DNA_END=739 /DNA_ORIENTATION=-